MTANPHQAGHAALGYLYQSQWPLLELLRRDSTTQDAALTMELHDDVAFEVNGKPAELLQVKHHIQAVKGIGDMDADLWKTLDVWTDAHPPGDPDGPVLSLVTTAVASAGTAAAHLAPDRDAASESAARGLLDAAATGSANIATATARDRWLAMPPADRDVFVSRIVVLDGQAGAGDALDAEVRHELRWALATVSGHEDSFMEQLWGWWLGVAVEMLRSGTGTVRALDVAQTVNELADGYRPDNLPILVGRDDVLYDIEQTVGTPVFVEQLRWISHTPPMLQKAMVDYYRAYAQRAKWIDRDLIGPGELKHFEDNLTDEWDRAFQSMIVRLGGSADEDAKAMAGHELFVTLTNQTVVKIRDRFDDPFFMRGQLHAFSDVGAVGWHADFVNRVRTLIGQ